MEKMQRNADQKDKILSAMMRTSKIDTAEKQVLVKEVKALKAKKKQVELEADRWRWMAESKRRKAERFGHSVEAECSRDRRDNTGHKRSRIRSRIRLLEYLDAESKRETECQSSSEDDDDCMGAFGKENEELIMTDIRHLQEWVQGETEKYATALEQRHLAETEAFAEQMREKDEKLEVLRWQFLTAELEMKQLQSHIEGLDGNLLMIREENIELEVLLLDREKELKSVKDRFALHMLRCRKKAKDVAAEPDVRRRSKDRQQDFHKTGHETTHPEVKKTHSDSHSKNYEQKLCLHSKNAASSNVSRRPSFEGAEIVDQDPTKDIVGINQVCRHEIEEEKEVIVDRGHTRSYNRRQQDIGIVSKEESTWKMDMQAMGVSCKIKRLKQQLVVLEKLAGKDSSQKAEKRHTSKGFQLLTSLLNKQVDRYESLEEKTNNLCIRMHDNEQDREGKDSDLTTTKEENKRLETFLEESFKLQRYMVATGQKLLDIQSRITYSFIRGDEEFGEHTRFNMGQFADIVRSLFRDIQRGLEVRIARIIGNLEGTLVREGILKS